MFKKTVSLTAAAAVVSMFAGAAVANQTFHPANNEAGVITHSVPGSKTRAQVEAEQIAAAATAVGNWRHVGGDIGWELVQHAYVFRNGKLVHADQLEHNAPKPSLASIAEGRKQYAEQYSGR